MKKFRTWFITPVIIGSLIGLFLLQMLLTPKYKIRNPEGSMVREYYRNAGNHDVIFIGDCEVYENFSPVTLWEEFGISSYIRGSAQQMIWQSYYLMEETFRYETPKVMVFNVLSMKYDTPESTGNPDRREAYNRMTLDGMRWSISKWRSIQASMTEEERNWHGPWTYLFPILRYHDRWHQLTEEDWRYLFCRDEVTDNGYLMQTGIRPVGDAHEEKPLPSYGFGENSWYYLDKMTELCRQHGTELVLIKAPSLYPVWWDEWDSQIEAYAGENGLKYYNLLDEQDKIGINWARDTYDTGLHLNVYGAEKLSSYFGKILVQEHRIPDRRENAEFSAEWCRKTEIYHQRKRDMVHDMYDQGG